MHPLESALSEPMESGRAAMMFGAQTDRQKIRAGRGIEDVMHFSRRVAVADSMAKGAAQARYAVHVARRLDAHE